jgi:hypothetical protein
MAVFATNSYSSGAGIYAFSLFRNLNDFSGGFFRTGTGERAGDGEDAGSDIREWRGGSDLLRSGTWGAGFGQDRDVPASLRFFRSTPSPAPPAYNPPHRRLATAMRIAAACHPRAFFACFCTGFFCPVTRKDAHGFFKKDKTGRSGSRSGT